MHLLLRRFFNRKNAGKSRIRDQGSYWQARAHLDQLTISWFGGEPLLAQSVVSEIGDFAYQTCKQADVKFSAGFTTNGYLLTPELFAQFVAMSHRQFQITLDGDEEWHDKTRILANRRPTFTKIWSNLVAFSEVAGDFNITLRLHIHSENIESVKRLYERVKDKLLTDARFNVYFHKVSNLHPDRLIKEKILGRQEYMDAISYIIGEKNPVPSGKGAISEEHLDGYICYAAKPNSLLIRANGGIGKCTVALGDERNDIGRINPDGTLEIRNERLQKWFSGYADLSERALGCPLSTLT